MNELNKIVDGGYCIGCGACAVASPSFVRIYEDKYLKYKASIDDEIDILNLKNALDACPFSNNGKNEDEISEDVFDYSLGKKDDVIGYFQGLYAGHIVDDDIRVKTTSGGIITWTLNTLLQKNMVDYVIHVKKSNKAGLLFEYGISKTIEEVIAGAKSRYYPVEISQVLDFVKNNEGRYVFVGLPCFVKSVRKLSQSDNLIASRIKYTIGLVCGHLKSKAFAELVAWQGGVRPSEIKEIDFRYKLDDRPADNYGIRITDVDDNTKILVARETFGTNWGHGFFKYEACDYCDDIFSETADLTVGDAWLKSYTKDVKGNSVVVVRNNDIHDLLKDGIRSEEIMLDELSQNEMRQSQGGGFRHRRSGLGYRLYVKSKKKRWAPKKRVEINKNAISGVRKVILVYRSFIMKKSSAYWLQARMSGDYDSFMRKMHLINYFYDFLLKFSSYMKKIK